MSRVNTSQKEHVTGLATGVLAAAMGAHTAWHAEVAAWTAAGIIAYLKLCVVWRCDGGGSDGGGQSACIVRTISEPCLTR